jgi:uncharacterized membrane protein
VTAPARPSLAARAVWALMLVHAAAFSWLSVARHEAYSSGRFDLGNMVQAIWSTAQGRFLETTDVSGEQFSRLGAHVDPILALFAPIFRFWPEPNILLVTQAVVVSLGALPVFWLARLWLQSDKLAVASAAVYLLYPPLHFAVLFDFHPVTLAAPLLLYCIWAAETGKWWTLGICGALAALTQEQVGLMLVTLAIWMAVRHPARRRQAAVLAGAALSWVIVAMAVIIPAFAVDAANPHLVRYQELGDSPVDIITTFFVRPWEVLGVVATPDRALYLLILLAPLLFLPLSAPLLAACALPQLAINLFAADGPAQSIEYHYTAVLTPFLIAASIMGLARLRERELPAWLAPRIARPGLVAAAMVGVVALSGIPLGPMPGTQHVPLVGWSGAAHIRFSADPREEALDKAVSIVPDDAIVSASNDLGAHLSARRRVYLFPRKTNPADDTQWIVVSGVQEVMNASRHRPTLKPIEYRPRLVALIRNKATWREVFTDDGVRVFRRLKNVGVAQVPPSRGGV